MEIIFEAHMISDRFKNFGGRATNMVFVVLVVLLVAFISSRRFMRFDLTEDSRYTISNTTKDTLGSLDDVVTVKVFFSKKLPADLQELAQIVRDTLDEYKSFSPSGYFDVRYIDPAESDQARSEATALGIPEVRMQFVKQDKAEVQNGFLGIGIYYEDKKEALPFVAQTANFEYDLTATIKKVTTSNIKTVGFLTGHNERSILEDPFGDRTKNGEYTELKRVLEKTYAVKSVDVSTGEDITGVDTLVVAGPKLPLSARDLYEIDQFVMRGGSVVWLVEGVDVSTTLQAVIANNNIGPLLKHYGFGLEPVLVKDAIHETATFSQGYSSLIVPYPLWPKLVKQNFLASNPVVSSIDSLVLPWSSPITLVDKEGSALAQTTDQAFSIASPFSLDPMDRTVSGKQEQFVMVAFKNAALTSFYAGKEVPPVSDREDKAADKESTQSTPQSTADLSKKVTKPATDDKIRMLAVGNSLFATNSMARQFPENLNFIQNAIDYITLDSSLIEIRAKTFSQRPLREVSDRAKTTVKFLVIFGIPIIVALGGFAKSWMRKKAKNRLLAL